MSPIIIQPEGYTAYAPLFPTEFAFPVGAVVFFIGFALVFSRGGLDRTVAGLFVCAIGFFLTVPLAMMNAETDARDLAGEYIVPDAVVPDVFGFALTTLSSPEEATGFAAKNVSPVLRDAGIRGGTVEPDQPLAEAVARACREGNAMPFEVENLVLDGKSATATVLTEIDDDGACVVTVATK